MSSISKEEKLIINAIVQGEGYGRNFINIFNMLSGNQEKVRIQVDKQQREGHFLIEMIPGELDAATSLAVTIIPKLTEELILFLSIVDELHEGKKVYLHTPTTDTSQVIEFGMGAVNRPTISTPITDSGLIDLIIKYARVELIPTSELKRFCERDYKSEEEARFEKQNRNAKIALIFAIASPLILSGVNIYLKHSSQYEVPQMVNSIESAILKGSTVNYSAQIDQLGNNIDQIANEMTAISGTYNAIIPTKSLEPLSSHELVIRIQKSLNMLGYKAGEEDGVLGKNTIRAIREFQINNQEEVSGIPSHSLLENLLLQIES